MMDAEATPRSLMAGNAGVGPLCFLLWEVFKWLVLRILHLYLYPLKLLLRAAGYQKPPAVVKGSAFITGCDMGIGRATALLLSEKVRHGLAHTAVACTQYTSMQLLPKLEPCAIAYHVAVLQGWNVFAGVLLPESQAELSWVSTAIKPLLVDVTE